MKRNARNAFKQLEKLNAPVYDRSEYGAHFILGAEKRTSKDNIFADYWGNQYSEYMNQTGKIKNSFNVSETVHVIMRKYGLMIEWINPGMLGVYDA